LSFSAVPAPETGRNDRERIMADKLEKTGNPIIDNQQERVAVASGHDRKRLRLALGIALAVHLVFLAVRLPQMTEAQPPEEPEEEPYVVHQVKFRPPPPPPPEPQEPPPEPEEPPPPEAKKIPVPDPEPQEPEPVVEQPEPEPPPPEPVPEPPPRHEEVVRIVEQPQRPAPPQELPTPDVAVTIPEGPPPEPEPTGPIRVGGNVKAPVKINAPDPEYTEPARSARLEGVVIIEAIIDKNGRVKSTKIVKDQPMGLGASAERAIRGWTFKPATLNGKPVEVYYNLTVNFQLD
jgi:periplasmic protein TonB